ncbi:MAG: ACT domain-containing protein [Clostridiales bacterium]|nr:ACT domain-containing protein [Clostridiales bacterium]
MAMASRGEGRSYVVSEDILPEAILKTSQAKEMLTRGDALTVNEAVEKVGMSRSAYYKYRDGVQPYAREDDERSASMALILEHRAGVLSGVLSAVASMKGNIDSINQSMPVQGVAIVTMNVNTTLVGDMNMLIRSLQNQEGVIRAELVSQH